MSENPNVAAEIITALAPLVTAIGFLVTAGGTVWSIVNSSRAKASADTAVTVSQATHASTNSQMDALKKLIAKASFAEGLIEGKANERASVAERAADRAEAREDARDVAAGVEPATS